MEDDSWPPLDNTMSAAHCIVLSSKMVVKYNIDCCNVTQWEKALGKNAPARYCTTIVV